MKLFVQKILKLMARTVLWRHRPCVIAITGSIGKTTTKDALYTILSSKHAARTNIGNYNNEFGVPLTIIGAPSGGRSLFGWLRVFGVWLWDVTIAWNYPRVLVLEFGIDQVGDMAYLVSIAQPQMGVVTVVEGVHAEKFGSVATIAREKGMLVELLAADGVAVLNADDVRVAKMAGRTKARVHTYTTADAQDAAVRIGDIATLGQGGLTFKVHEAQTTVPVRLPHIIGAQMVPSVAAAITAARAYGMNLADIAAALSAFRPPKGRMNVIHTEDGVVVIDDTYNAAPASMRGAIAALGQFPLPRSESRQIAVLGDMFELGETEVADHAAMAQSVLINKIDAVVCVGALMKNMYDALVDACEKDYQVTAPYYYATTAEAAADITQIVSSGDVVLCKGSQGMRMEKILEELVEPEKQHLLARQTAQWKNTPIS